MIAPRTCHGCGASERARRDGWEAVFVNATYGRGGKFLDFCPDRAADGTADRFCDCADRRQRFVPTKRRPHLHLISTRENDHV